MKRRLQDLRQLRGWPSHLVDMFEPLIPSLDQYTGGNWLITGGTIASLHSGREIGTADVDAVVIDPYGVAEAFEQEYGFPTKSITEALDNREGVSVEIADGVFLDLISPSFNPSIQVIEEDALENPVIIKIPGGGKLRVIPVGNLIVTKALTARTRDLFHIEELIAAGHKQAALRTAKRLLDPSDYEEVEQTIAVVEEAAKPKRR